MAKFKEGDYIVDVCETVCYISEVGAMALKYTLVVMKTGRSALKLGQLLHQEYDSIDHSHSLWVNYSTDKDTHDCSVHVQQYLGFREEYLFCKVCDKKFGVGA